MQPKGYVRYLFNHLPLFRGQGVRRTLHYMKRNEYLKPVSRDHHYGLLLCWKIREGLKKGIAPERIKKYADWFFISHLKPHFAIEGEIYLSYSRQ